MTSESRSPSAPAAMSTAELFLKLINSSLYERTALIGGDSQEQVSRIRLHKGKFDMYCPLCGKAATWGSIPSANDLAEVERAKLASSVVTTSGGRGGIVRFNWLNKFELRIGCTRNSAHSAIYYFDVIALPEDGADAESKDVERTNSARHVVIKIGQYPSLTDFHLGDLSEFEEGMTKKQRREFVQATNSAAHGYSVAACVYLRRVFEDVLEEARDAHMAEHKLESWPEFEKAHTDEKIKLLGDRLPGFLSEHPQLYGILSIGVHELTESECADELPMLRQAIELILRDRVNAIRERKQRADVSKLVAQAVNRHKDRK